VWHDSLGRENGIAKYDVIAVARKALVRTQPGRKNPIPL
jgi:hypothetical protein